MTAELSIVQPQAGADLTAIERVIVAGDLSKLTPAERWDYYQGVCRSIGLNPFTKPFEYITLNGKLVLYALKGASDQLRAKHGISISQPRVEIADGLCMVTVSAADRTGRTDSDLGIVPCENLRGDAKANAILKAITKAKRRVTLSMCGLGMLDETEVETIPSARPANIETVPASSAPVVEQPALAGPATPEQRSEFEKVWKRGVAAAMACGVAAPDEPPMTATNADLRRACRELSDDVQARRTLNDELTAKIAQVRALGAELVVEVDPATCTSVEVHEMIGTLSEMLAAADTEAGEPELDTPF